MLTDDELLMVEFGVVQKIAEGLINAFTFCETEGRALNDLQLVSITTAMMLASGRVKEEIQESLEGQKKFREYYRTCTDEDISNLLRTVNN